jgi:hypothetical protein
MTDPHLLDVMAVFSAVLLALVLFSVRRAHIRVEYSVAWLVAAALLLLASRVEFLRDGLASLMGLESSVLALVIFAAFVFLVVFYRFSLRISDLKDANIALAQRLAILEYQLREYHEEQQGQSQSRA